MFILKGNGIICSPKKHIIESDNPAMGLDVCILQDYILAKVFQIKDPRQDKRLQVVDGLQSIEKFESLAKDGIGFAMYAVDLDTLMHVADHDLVMPPKSTFFTPKLRFGLAMRSLVGK